MQDIRYTQVKSILRSATFRKMEKPNQIATLKDIQSLGISNQEMVMLINQVRAEEENQKRAEKFAPAPITVAAYDETLNKRKPVTRPQVLKIERPFIAGDIVFADSERHPSRDDTIIFGVVDHITPTGKLVIHILDKQIGNAIAPSGDELSKTEVLPTNKRQVPRRSIPTDINGNNGSQHLFFELYDPNRHYYDITRDSYDR